MFITIYIICALLFFVYALFKNKKRNNSEHWVGTFILSISLWWILFTVQLVAEDSYIREDFKKLKKYLFN